MNFYYGFDLGDAESAIASLQGEDQAEPVICPLEGEKSFVTAYAHDEGGRLLIGENACYAMNAGTREVRFKSRFLTDKKASADIRYFASGVLSRLREQPELTDLTDCCFYIGCPAGWNKNARERYRFIFEQTGFPPVRIVSESRAALVSACQSKYLQVGYDILSKPVLVIDAGSSTTDFAYIAHGREVQLKTAGEVFLGGGILDELLLEASVSCSEDPDKIRNIFEQSPAWKNYCEFAARRLKELYFEDEEYWETHECSRTLLIRSSARPVRFKIMITPEIADDLLNGPAAFLQNRSFSEVFLSSLRQVRQAIDGPVPELIFLTGGVSKMPVIREWCMEVFPESVIITGTEPAFSVAKGLAWCGRIDAQVKAFKQDVAALIDSPKVENIVELKLDALYEAAAEAIVDPILQNAAIPVFDRWRNGSIRRLCDVDGELQKAITTYLNSDEARQYLTEPVTAWLKEISNDLEEYTVPICIRHHVPHTALALNTYLSANDLEIRLEARDIFRVQELTWLIDTVISILVGLLCGGSGVALIASGLPGIAAGAVISLLVLLLGKGKMEKALLKMDIPSPARRLIPRNHFASRIDALGDEVRISFCQSLLNDKNREITDRMAEDISRQIESCLTKMAEVVEIPLGS